MIVMMDSSTSLDDAATEIGMQCEQLMTPLTRYAWRGGRCAIDNGCYSSGSVAGLVSLLENRIEAQGMCRWVSVPDIVGSARRTLEVFEIISWKLNGWPLAYVAQDGQESIPIPWNSIACLFVGGTTEWKLGPYAEHCIRAAKLLDKWVHVGRVNSPERVDKFQSLGVDSIDGTGIARYSKMRTAVRDRHGLYDGVL
jgi:hypothetical protein